MPDGLLFAKHDVYAVIARQKLLLVEAYKQLPEGQAIDEEGVKRLKAEYMLNVPVLGEPYATKGTVRIDARRLPNRMFLPGTGPVMEEVTEFTVHVPFTGDAGVFDLAPSSYNGTAFRGQIVGQELRFKILAMVQGFDVQAEIDRQLQQVKLSLELIRGKEVYASQELENALRQAVTVRRRNIESGRSASIKLTIPLREPVAPVTLTKAVDRPILNRLVPPKLRHWDVFISHSSADKDYVRPLKDALEAAGIKVWYDETSMQWGDGLRRKINEGLINSDYAIVVLSKSFLAVREWTERELDALYARETKDRTIILPIWHGVDREDLLSYSPDLADRLAKISNTDDPTEIVESLRNLLGLGEIDATDTKLSSGPVQWKGNKNPAIAYCRFEIGGLNPGEVYLYVRLAPSGNDRFVFESSRGDEKEGTRQEVSARYAEAQRNLRAAGYRLMNIVGGGEYPEFAG